VDLTGHDLEIGLHIEGEHALIGLRLSDDAMAARSRVVHGVASLHPPIAHALCLLSAPEVGETFLDPMCGAGTVLVERGSIASAGLLLGADRDTEVLRLAGRNLRSAEVSASLLVSEGRHIPLSSGSVDKIVCNMPWGRRVGSHRANRRLYPAFLAEAVRVLRPGGRMVLLSLEKRLMDATLQADDDLVLDETHRVNTGGLIPSIYALSRR